MPARTTDDCFRIKQNVAVDSSDSVFVADFGNDCIQKFTDTGRFIKKWGSLGSASIDVTGSSALSALIASASPFG